jgi:ribonucleoside-diphosphate reductase alpha chain
MEPRFSANARTVLERRYLRRNERGVVAETPSELLTRVAHAVAAVEGQTAEQAEGLFRDALFRLELLPNSPTLMNAGRPLGQLSACFVLPVEDSLAAIFDAVKWAALIQQTGGGTGFAFSRLRPAGDLVASTHGIASGPVSFIDVFNAATDAIRQGGARRGANMAILRVDHPDILAFIARKADPGALTNFNVSVAVTDEFMTALAAGGEYSLRNPRSGQAIRQLSARRVWDTISRMAWLSGEPGVVFLDRINRDNPTPDLGEMEATNPCGELPLLPFESCNLASIDVSKVVRPDGSSFDWERLGHLVRVGVRFLDDVIDANSYPLGQIGDITYRNRKIGLGVMGLADALIAMNVAYDSERALEIGEELATFLDVESLKASAALAETRGPFPGWETSLWKKRGVPPLRNATTTSIAPTGTISILAGCSGGIEPNYAVSFVREVLEGTRLVETHAGFAERARAEGWGSTALFDEIAERGSVRGLTGVPEAVQRVYLTAYDVAPLDHVRMQAAFQRHVHNAVSKTINFPKRAAVEDVASVYREAYRLGCKGVTVYRDGSREHQVLSFGRSTATGGAVPRCPDCGNPVGEARTGACVVCVSCGWSTCP